MREPRRAGTYLSIAFLALLWLILCRHLSSEWSINEQYSYGWFVPFFAAYLFWLRWEDRPTPRPHTRDHAPTFATAPCVAALLFLLPLRLFEIGNPDWRPLGWLHASVVVTVTLLLVRQIGGNAWLKHFAFPLFFIFVAVPWIHAIETPIIQGLMRFVAAVTAEIVNLLGVPAQLEGNLIRVNTSLVGVNEACSGVRSLQTSLMIGLLFGELKRLALVRRIALIAGAFAIAMVANCARALLLVWLATTGTPDSLSRWHDVAGYSIVVIVFIGTVILSAVLARSKAEPQKSNAKPPASHFHLPTSIVAFASIWLVLVELASEFWYRAHERNLVAEQSWSLQWPTATPGFRDIAIDEGVRRALRFDDGREAAWPLSSPNETKSLRAFAFFFRWNSGGSSVLRARAHRPDICLPSVGWIASDDRGSGEYPVGDVAISFRRVSFRRANASAMAYTFFCLQEDRRRPSEPRPDLLPLSEIPPARTFTGPIQVVRNGVRNLGQQVLEVVLLSPEPIDQGEVDQTFTRLLQELIVSRALPSHP